MSMEVTIAVIVLIVVGLWLRAKHKNRNRREAATFVSLVPGATAVAPSPRLLTDQRRSRGHLRLVDARFTAPAPQQAINRKDLVLPALPAEQETVVRAYLRAGMDLGFALESMHRGTCVHPVVVNRFADAEAAYAGLGYRTATPAAFRALVTSDVPLPESEQPCTLRSQGEEPVLCAQYVRAEIRQRCVGERK